jgi:threonine dehydrogenase-like Zn-dependent dehydrogenase
MNAIAIYPGQPHSVHLTTLPRPTPGAGEALVGVRRVGICGTDHELIAAKFGAPPPGSEELVLGHEMLGVVESLGAAVHDFAVGDLVVATVRRPDECPACLAGQPDMCVWSRYTERGIVGAHGFMVEQIVEDARWLLRVDPALESLGILVEPLSVAEKAVRQADLIQRRLAAWSPKQALVIGAGPIGLLATLLLRARGLEVVTVARKLPPTSAAAIVTACGGRYVSTRETTLAELAATLPPIDLIIEATGSSQMVVEAMSALGNSGVLVLLSGTSGHTPLPVPMDAINRGFVVGNKVMVGSVNSAIADFAAALADLGRFEQLWPGLPSRLITHRLAGFSEFAKVAMRPDDGIKTVIEIG